MNDGFGELPTFASGFAPDLSPSLLTTLQAQQQGQPQGPAQGLGTTAGFGAEPPAMPPGYSGFNPSTPPTGGPTPVVQPGAASFASAAANAFGPSSAQAATMSPPAQGGGYADRVIGTESGGDNYAKNPRSSATGAGQFIDSTWLDQVRKNRPDLAGLPDGQILSLPSDPNLSRQMTEAYGNENGARLSAAGLPVNDGTKYLAHFAGPQGAINVLSADPSTPVSRVLTPGQISANPHIANMTAGQLAAWAGGQVGGGASGGGGGGGGSSAGSQMSPGIARPAGTSMGSTAQAGAFRLGGIQGLGSAVPGQSSPTPDVASLSDQPLTATGAPAQQPSNYYGNIANALGAVKAQQQQGQKKDGMQLARPYKPSPISLTQARAMTDPSQFFTMLQQHGINAAGAPGRSGSRAG